MNKLQDIKNKFLLDGVIDADEVKVLEAVIYDDARIDKEEAQLLFEINDAVSGNNNDGSWNEFFIKAISDYLLNDENSPGEIDQDKAEWLYSKIKGDKQIDSLEKELLQYLKSNAKKFPEILEELL